jgi:C-methyltransferase C-terminal domain/Putative zinc binding domain/Methyltransferase domain
VELACRACRRRDGQVVLDLGDQPACDYFPASSDPGPDPVYPLQMWLCAQCGLAQLAADPTVPSEPRATEPAALIAQAADAVNRVSAAGLLSAGARVAEYGSPHGGSWLELLLHKGLIPVRAGEPVPVRASEPVPVRAGEPVLVGTGDPVPVRAGEPADVIIDCFGLMHEADQAGALAERLARLADDGVLLLQYHSLDSIIRLGQWNALRHGHYAYYSTTALTAMLAAQGCEPFAAWKFDLYGGTVLLAARRSRTGSGLVEVADPVAGAVAVPVGRAVAGPAAGAVAGPAGEAVAGAAGGPVAGAAGGSVASPVGRAAGGPGAGAAGGPVAGAAGGPVAGPVAGAAGGPVGRATGRPGAGAAADAEAADLVAQLLADEAEVGVCDPDVLLGLQDDARATADGLRDWLLGERAAGRSVLGYGAASRAIALLCDAKIDRSLLPAIVDASPAKHGLRMPGTDIPVVGPDRLTASPPTSVLLFVADLRPEVSAAFPQIEAAGGRWIDADFLARRPA